MSKAKEFLLDYMNNHPDNINKDGKPYFQSLYKMLNEIYSPIETQDEWASRWWTNFFAVQEINGKLIGFMWASTTGDDSAYWKGWKFDEDSICFVEPYEVTVTKYRKIDG